MKPMLAATLDDLEKVTLPAYVSPKLDGIRCLIVDGVAVSRALKPIPNKYIQEKLKGLPDGLDGELMTKGDFNTVQSAVMSEDGEPEFFYVLFDLTMEGGYKDRYFALCDTVETVKNPFVKVIQTTLIESIEELKRIEEVAVAKRYEGVMIRSIDSPYKSGRSTLKEQFLMKYKRFKDAEAVIIGFQEKMHNANEAEKDNLGHTKRSTKKDGLVPTGTLGSLVVTPFKGKGPEFNIGTGFTEEQRENIWINRHKYMGKQVTYRYQDETADGVPRFPVFKGFRIE